MRYRKVVTRDEYNAQHILCPKCKADHNIFATNIVIITSEAKDYTDRLNTAWCNNCGWRGMRNELEKPLEN